MNGLELKLPGGRESFVEVRNEWLGFGLSGDENDREIYLGFLQATVSKTRGFQPSQRRMGRALAVAFLCGLAIPVEYGKAFEMISGWSMSLMTSPELVSEKSR